MATWAKYLIQIVVTAVYEWLIMRKATKKYLEDLDNVTPIRSAGQRIRVRREYLISLRPGTNSGNTDPPSGES
jgi:hypothetical protein